jgi:glycosyltransferase involved in cell wall biosynthesis
MALGALRAGGMRIGIASEWIGEQVGGLERQSTDLIRSMLAIDAVNKYAVFVTHRGARSLGPLDATRASVRATAFNSRWYYVPVGLPLAVLRHPVDVLHATFTVVPWCPAKRIVLTVHDVCPRVHPDFFPAGVNARFEWLLQQGIRRATRIVVPSELTRQELVQHYPVDVGKIVVIPNGVRPRLLDAPSSTGAGDAFDERKWPRDFALYVGRFHARKNIQRLIEAFSQSRARRNGLRLVLVGRDLWSGAQLAQRIHDLGLDDEVLCPGHVSDTTLGELYARARLFAFPSVHEGFGIPPVEAMAYGVPVLACRISAMPEVLGDAAYYCDPYDVEDMAAALDRLVEDDALRADLVRRGRARARVFAWSGVAERTLSMYRDVAVNG